MKFFVVDDLELRLMNDKDALGKNGNDIVHVHVCVHCGHARRREEVDSREVTAGILRCPKCGFDGPLNIEIRDLPTV